MNSKVVKDKKSPRPLALLLQRDQKVLKVIRVVALRDDVVVDEPSELTNTSDYSHRRSAILDKLEAHLGDHPALAHLLPQVESGFINVHNLIPLFIQHVLGKLLHKLHLLHPQLIDLGPALPILVVGSFVLNTILEVVPPESLMRERFEIEFFLDYERPLLEAQMRHLLQSVWRDN